MQTEPCHALVINAPEAFADPAFQAWLTNGKPKFTWWQSGPIAEYADVVVLVDPSLTGEGSDSDMPAHIWDKIVEECRRLFGARTTLYPPHHIMVRLTNLA